MATIAIKRFNPVAYERIGYDELTTYAIYSLAQKEMEATFENIVAETFALFPKRFSLRGYPQWPDASVVNKSWLRCRTDKHYIEGSVKDGFKLTPRGFKIAEQVERQLKGEVNGNAKKELKAEIRTKAGRLLRALEKSSVSIQYKETGSLDTVKDHELTDMLLCMPDSDTRVIKHNIEQFKQAAELYQRQDLLQLLARAENRLLKVPHSGMR